MVVIYLSPVDWNSIAQRPHFFVKYLLDSKKADKVFWINPTPSRLPKLLDIKTRLFNKLEPNSINKVSGLEVISPGFFIPVEPFPILFYTLNLFTLYKIYYKIKNLIDKKNDILFIQGKPSRLAQFLCHHLRFKKRIFDMMDDFPYFFTGVSKNSMTSLIHKTLSESDLVIFSSTNLLYKYSSFCKKNCVIKNACSSEIVNIFTSIEHKIFRKKNTIYGYIGNINTWFDWDFIFKLAHEKPTSLIRIIGPCYTSIPNNLPTNVRLESAVDHKEIPKILTEFDFGLIPFKINELTESVDPVKYYEYIAANLPVISSYFGEMKYRIDSNYAYSLSSYLNGKTIKKDNVITWEERFSNLDI